MSGLKIEFDWFWNRTGEFYYKPWCFKYTMKGKSAHPFSEYHQITKIKLPIGFVIWEGRLGISKKRYVHIYVYTNHIYIYVFMDIYTGGVVNMSHFSQIDWRKSRSGNRSHSFPSFRGSPPVPECLAVEICQKCPSYLIFPPILLVNRNTVFFGEC